MGQGSYVLCEWCSIQEAFPQFEEAVRKLDQKILLQCSADWKKTPGYIKTSSGQYGRTTILPAMFDDHSSLPMNSTRSLLVGGATWRQLFTTAGHQQLLAGVGASNIIPEDIKIALMGFAFPNKEQHITEIKMQIGDQKLGRINLEQMLLYKKPALVFADGYLLDEKQGFELYGNVKGPIPVHNNNDAYTGLWQYIIPIGAAYYKTVDKVLGNCGAAITTT